MYVLKAEGFLLTNIRGVKADDTGWIQIELRRNNAAHMIKVTSDKSDWLHFNWKILWELNSTKSQLKNLMRIEFYKIPIELHLRD